MMEFLAANFNLPTIIVGAIVFGGVGWITCTLISMAAAVDVAAAVTAAAVETAVAAAVAATERSRRRRGRRVKALARAPFVNQEFV